MRRVLPSEPTALTAPGQGASKADSDAALQGPQGLAGIGVAIGVDPPPPHVIPLRHKVRRRTRGAPFGNGLAAPPHAAWRRLTGKEVDGLLAAGRAASLHEVASEEVTALRPFRDACLVAIERPSPPSRQRGTRLQRLRGACATNADGIVGIALQRGTQLLRRAPLMPHLVSQGQGDRAVPRCQRRPWRDAPRGGLSLPVGRDAALAALLEQPQQTPIDHALSASRHQLGVGHGRKGAVQSNVHDAPGPSIEVFLEGQ